MTRHGRNATASAVYTYHEKQKDTKTSGYGSQKLRFGKDSIKEFDCCCLTLQPCRNPVITSDGFLFDKEAILEYIIHKKREIARKLKEYEKQKTRFAKEASDLSKAEQKEKLDKFIEKQTFKTPQTDGPGTSKGSLSNVAGEKRKELPSFWVPSLTPKAKSTDLKKPEEKVRCPMSGKPLKLKDLIDIHFTPINDGDNRSLITKDARFVCAVSNDVLGNSVPAAVLITSGSVVTMEVVEKIIKKDMIDPINGKPLTDKMIIPLQRGATGFAGAGVKLEAKKDGPSMQ